MTREAAVGSSDETFVQTLLEYTNDVLVVLDADGVLRYVSPAARWVLGYDAGEHVGKSAFELVHPDDREDAVAALGRSLAAGRGALRHKRLRVRDGDGSWREVELSSSNLLDDPVVGGFIVSVRDVSERVAMETALRVSDDQYRRLVELAAEGIWVIDADSVTTLVNPCMADMLGYSVDEMIGASLFQFMDDEGRAIAERNVERRRQGIAEQHDFRFVHRSGRVVWATLNTSPIVSPDGTYEGALAVVADVTRRREADEELRASEERFRVLLQHASDVVLTVDRTGVCTYASPSVEAVFGYSPGEILGVQTRDLVHPDDADRVQQFIADRDNEASGAAPSIEFRVRHRDQRWCTVETVMSNLVDHPAVRGIVCNLRDVTDLRAAQARLEHQATHDELTGLANRPLLFSLGTQALARAGRDGSSTAFLYLDLDGFKDVNDTFGHGAGDRVLVEVGRRLTRAARIGDLAARLGGDEFGILCEHVAGADEAIGVARRVVDTVSGPIVLGAQTLEIGVTIGVATSTDPNHTFEQLVHDADAALYRAKRSAGATVELWSPTTTTPLPVLA